jgi:hypothetical protein
MNLPFADDTFVPLEFLKLKEEFNIEVAVETGTNKGDTTYWLAKNFDAVYTIEQTTESLNKAKENCKEFNNIIYLEGSSVTLMYDLVEEIKDKRTIFFLDAHGTNPCPTSIELLLIKNMNVKPIIAIHDFYVPNKNFNWDSYNDFEYKWENIESLVNDIYGSDYTYYYNLEANGYKVGVIYIKPKR